MQTMSVFTISLMTLPRLVSSHERLCAFCLLKTLLGCPCTGGLRVMEC
jgi:hypothetical protein